MPAKYKVDWVDPYIGSIGHLLTATHPTVKWPHGMAESAPCFNPGLRDYYVADRIFAFPALDVRLMVAEPTHDPADFSAQFDHGSEEVHPYRYCVRLIDCGIRVEVTSSPHGLFYRFLTSHSGMSLLLQWPQGYTCQTDGKVLQISGTKPCEFSHGRPLPQFVQLQSSNTFTHQPVENGLLLTCQEHGWELRIGLSYIDQAQAADNISRELNKSFGYIAQVCRRAWENLLSRINVKGGSNDDKTTFYTALYRVHCRMNDIAEYGRYYSGWDGQVHEGEHFYVGDGLWDTYRCTHPLQLIHDPLRQQDMLDSYLRMYQQGGWMASFPSEHGDRPVMIGFHAAAMFADAAAKGLTFDQELAYEALRKDAMEASMLPWRCSMGLTELDKMYHDQGFFPALNEGEAETHPDVHSFEGRQAVAVTLEHAYDDWCVSQLAARLGKTDDAAFFAQRALNYQKLYHPELGWMAPRNAQGEWVAGFDPKWGGGQGGRRYFAENNSWIYTFHVQHDIDGLASLMGGPEALEARLDAMFTEGYDGRLKSTFLNQFPDATGLMGQFCMGNEPAFHIPYLYNYTASPWKAQRHLRDIMRLWFTASPLGICGDEDGGAMSAWYVFSAMGFYPTCPGKPEYDIGSPIFHEITIQLPDDKTFTIRAPSAALNRFVLKATLNGTPLTHMRFDHSAIAQGGVLELMMGFEP